MATLSVRNLPDIVHRRLRLHAADLGISVEEAARRILDEATRSHEPLGDVLAAFAKEHDAEDLMIQRDQTPASPASFK